MYKRQNKTLEGGWAKERVVVVYLSLMKKDASRQTISSSSSFSSLFIFFFQIITRVFFMENDKGFWWFSAVCFYFSFLILIFLLFLGLIPKNRLGLGTQKITGLNQISFNHMMKKLMFTKIIMGKTKRVHLFKDFIKWEVHQLKSTSSPSNLLFKDFITWFY